MKFGERKKVVEEVVMADKWMKAVDCVYISFNEMNLEICYYSLLHNQIL